MSKPESPTDAVARILSPALLSLGRSGYVQKLRDRYVAYPSIKRLLNYKARLRAQEIARDLPKINEDDVDY